MTLIEYRKQWERGGYVELEFPVDEFCFLVVVKFAYGTFDLLRYFKLGAEYWTVSVDEKGKSLEQILESIKEKYSWNLLIPITNGAVHYE